jgi:hypothetical protein
VNVAINGQNLEGTFMGDIMGKKTEKCIRIGFNNINGFHTSGPQSNDLRSFIMTHEFDVFGMCEVNTHWKHSTIHVQDATLGWFNRLHCSLAYYAQYPVATKFQSGGVMQFVVNMLTSRVVNSGETFKDDGLGMF